MKCFASFARSSALLALAAAFAGPAFVLPNAAPAPGTSPAVAPELRVFDPSLIDTSVDPCENFYRFSCNGWFKRNPLPADQASYGRFTELYELNRLHLHEILEAAAVPSPTRTPNEQKIGDEYASCMDAGGSRQAGIEAARAGAGSHCRSRICCRFAGAAGAPADHRRERIFWHGSGQDFADARNVISFFSCGRAGAAGARLLHSHRRRQREAARAVCRPRTQDVCRWRARREAQAAQDADTVLAIETRLAKASLTMTEQRDPQNLNHPTDVAGMAKDADALLAGPISDRCRRHHGRQSERYGAEVLCRVQRDCCRYAARSDRDLPALASAHAYAGTSAAGELRP